MTRSSILSVVHNPNAGAKAGLATGQTIRFDSVSKVYPTYDDEVTALSKVSFAVGAGEFVSVLGPSGCGKSTLMLLAAGLEGLTAGDILIGDRRVERPITDIGIVFQDHALYDWRTIIDNIMLQAEIRKLSAQQIKQRALELLHRTGLRDFASKYPHELSGGMRQRAAICRALVHEPSLLFFDEPFGALDALTREQMRIDLEKLWLERRPTVLFITHSISEAVALSDRVVVMTARPGQVDTILNIDLPRPRDKAIVASKAFSDYADGITERFMAQGVIQY
jgi:NitT/TauT family transport system ATP-binding protein